MAMAKKLPCGSWRMLESGRTGSAGYKRFPAPTKKETALLAAQYVAQEARERKTGMRVGEAIDRYIEIKRSYRRRRFWGISVSAGIAMIRSAVYMSMA